MNKNNDLKRIEKEFNKSSALKRFWYFLQEDTWQSWIVSLLLLLVLIRFIFFPALSFVTGAKLPLVVVESCSMYHGESFQQWWERNSELYFEKEITKESFSEFTMKNGFNKGDIIFVWGRGELGLGDIIIFKPNQDALATHPIIHRIVGLNPIQTKGDHNSVQLVRQNNDKRIDETNTPRENVLGRAVFKIPYAGWLKLVFFEPFRPANERGFCVKQQSGFF